MLVFEKSIKIIDLLCKMLSILFYTLSLLVTLIAASIQIVSSSQENSHTEFLLESAFTAEFS
jgi:hypothetical protein